MCRAGRKTLLTHSLPLPQAWPGFLIQLDPNRASIERKKFFSQFFAFSLDMIFIQGIGACALVSLAMPMVTVEPDTMSV